MTGNRFPSVALNELDRQGLLPDSGPPRPSALVVDDEVVIADTLALILKREGFAAIAAYGSLSALQIATVIPPLILLTDVVMPDMNGIELAIEICKQVPDCHVVLLSGQAATVDMLPRYPEAKNFTVLAKPIHPRELVLQLSQVLQSPEPSMA
jgi:CheY-like chemotaxis protein